MNNQVIFVANDLIRINPSQPDTPLDLLKIQEIQESVLRSRGNGTKGILQVCKARKVGEVYELFFGRHRLAAFQELAKDDLFFDEFPLLVCDATDQEMFEAMGVENLSRRDLSLVEIGEMFRAYMEKFHANSVLTSQAFGKTDEYVRSAVRMAKAPEPVRKELQAGKITVTTARDLLVVNKLLGEEGIQEALDDIQKGTWDSPQEAIVGTLRSTDRVVELPNHSYSLQNEWVVATKYPYKSLPALGVQAAAKIIGFELKIHSDKQYLQNRINEFQEGKTIEDMPAYHGGSDKTREELEKLQVLVRPPACTACPFHAVFDGDHYCGLPACKERKAKGWKQKMIDEHVKKLKIALYDKEKDGEFIPLKRHHAPDQKLYEARGADLRVRVVPNKPWEDIGTGHDNVQVVLIGKAAVNRIKSQQGDIEKGMTENLDRENQLLVRNTKNEYLTRFAWEVTSTVFESALDGIDNPAVLSEIYDFGDYNHDADFPEGVDDGDELMEAAKKITKKPDSAKLMRRLIAHHMVFRSLDGTVLRHVRTLSKKPVLEIAEHLRKIGKEWGVKLPNDWTKQAERYQADLDAALKELKVQA